MEKTQLRILMKEKRKAVFNRADKNTKLSSRLIGFIEKNRWMNLFIYVSMENEANTQNSIVALQRMGKTIVIPYTNDGCMSVKVLNRDIKTEAVDRLGNICGVEKLPSCDFECDCAVVPMLAFNKNLYRLGYGGGFYDKFLSNFNGVKIGIAFDEQYSDKFREEEHDIPMDVLITPQNILYNKNYNGRS